MFTECCGSLSAAYRTVMCRAASVRSKDGDGDGGDVCDDRSDALMVTHNNYALFH